MGGGLTCPQRSRRLNHHQSHADYNNQTGTTMPEYTRNERLASLLFPDQADPQLRKLQTIEAQLNRKQPPRSNLTPDHLRGATSPLGGVAKKGDQS
jgi:hypothetical protein